MAVIQIGRCSLRSVSKMADNQNSRCSKWPLSRMATIQSSRCSWWPIIKMIDIQNNRLSWLIMNSVILDINDSGYYSMNSSHFDFSQRPFLITAINGHFGLRACWPIGILFSNWSAKQFLKNFPFGFRHRDQSNQFLYFPIYTVRVRFQNQTLKNEIIEGPIRKSVIYPNRWDLALSIFR